MRKKKSSKKKKTGCCVCWWGDCEAIHKTIRSKAPVDHVWNADKARVCLRPTKQGVISDEKQAFLEAMKRYFPLDPVKEAKGQKNLYIAPHHFPESLLVWRSKNRKPVDSFTEPLSRADMKAVDSDDIKDGRMMENSNTLQFLIGSGPNQARERRFMQTPMETRCVIDTFVQSMVCPQTNSRDTRMNSRAQSRTVTPSSMSPIEAAATIVAHSAGDSTATTNKKNELASEVAGLAPPILSANHLSQTPSMSALRDYYVKGFATGVLAAPALEKSAVIMQDNVLGGGVKETIVCDLFGNSSMEEGKLDGKPPSDSNDEASDDDSAADSVGECKRRLREKHANFKQGLTDNGLDLPAIEQTERFRAVRGVRSRAKLLIKYHGFSERFPLEKKVWYCPCPGSASPDGEGMFLPRKPGVLPPPPCKFFTLREREWLDRVIVCSSCSKRRLKEMEQQRRKVPSPDMPRYRPRSALTHEAAIAQCTSRQKKEKNLLKRVNRLLSRLSGEKKDLFVAPGSSVHKILSHAVEFILANKATTREEILRVLIEMQFDGTSAQSDPKKECIDHVLETIANMGRELAGTDSQCRYTASTVNAALCLFRVKGIQRGVLPKSPTVTARMYQESYQRGW